MELGLELDILLGGESWLLLVYWAIKVVIREESAGRIVHRWDFGFP